ncbi:Scr1 family TA system antitoxin-like transcriptional regulator [Embleya sp. NBC_00896]|uniref:helix-turn-helix domain-containing protein n=1 Tax=Embleya sp. NBC_00896 TaxID=2975961 RepID=UPI003864A57A|nr:helix-turn-helix transcriptional regulator [Embleya sp. NBC_00896]
MSAADRSGGDPAPELRFFGEVVRKLRVAKAWSQAQLGEAVGYSESQVGMVERAERIASAEFVRQADKALVAKGVILAGLPMLEAARYPAFFAKFALLEAGVISMYKYESLVVPGILQTEEYARAIFGARCPPLDDDEIERRVQGRLDRQRLLTRKPAPILGFVIEEWVLRRPIGGKAVRHEQLSRLLEASRMRNVTIQIMPLDREEHAGFDGPMTLIETKDRKSLAYVEGQGRSQLMSDPETVSILTQRYGILRAQALPTGESARLIEQLLGDS